MYEAVISRGGDSFFFRIGLAEYTFVSLLDGTVPGANIKGTPPPDLTAVI